MCDILKIHANISLSLHYVIFVSHSILELTWNLKLWNMYIVQFITWFSIYWTCLLFHCNRETCISLYFPIIDSYFHSSLGPEICIIIWFPDQIQSIKCTSSFIFEGNRSSETVSDSFVRGLGRCGWGNPSSEAFHEP